MNRRELGSYGEQLANTYLKRQGYDIIETNWRCPLGELDIITRKDDVLVFVEVRTRRAAADTALESVVPLKQKRLQNLVYTYLSEHDLDDVQWRIDVIAVAVSPHEQPIIEHVENALEW